MRNSNDLWRGELLETLGQSGWTVDSQGLSAQYSETLSNTFFTMRMSLDHTYNKAICDTECRTPVILGARSYQFLAGLKQREGEFRYRLSWAEPDRITIRFTMKRLKERISQKSRGCESIANELSTMLACGIEVSLLAIKAVDLEGKRGTELFEKLTPERFVDLALCPGPNAYAM